MPMKQVTLRRWEIAVSFIAITLAFVGGLVWINRVAQQNHRLIVQQRELSHQRIVDRKHSDQVICRKVDRLDSALLRIVATPRPALQPGQYGYDYWIHHPNETVGRPGTRQSALVRQAASDILSELRKAACDPANLTRGQGG